MFPPSHPASRQSCEESDTFGAGWHNAGLLGRTVSVVEAHTVRGAIWNEFTAGTDDHCAER
jgi:hypothetical protein